MFCQGGSTKIELNNILGDIEVLGNGIIQSLTNLAITAIHYECGDQLPWLTGMLGSTQTKVKSFLKHC